MRKWTIGSWGATAVVVLAANLPQIAGQSVPERLAWPETQGGGPFRRCVTARLCGEQRHDVVVVSGNTAVAWFEPAVEQSHAVLAFAATVGDVATLPFEMCVGGLGRDELAIAAVEGLMRGGLNDGTAYVQFIDRTTPWKNARRVRAADVDGDGRVDLVVLRSDGRTIAVKRQAANGGFVDAPALGFVAPHAVRDFDLAELDGDPAAPEVVIDDANGLAFFGLGGSGLASHACVRPDLDAFTVLHGDPAAPGDRVLWCTAASIDPADATRALFVVDAASATLQLLTAAPLGTLASGRFDLDDVADACAMVGREEQLALLYAQAGPPLTFDLTPDHSTVIGLLAPGTGVAAPTVPLVADLGNDGVDDLFVPLATSREAIVLEGPLARPGDVLYALSVADFVHDGECFEPLDANGGIVVYVRASFPGASDHANDPSWQLESRVYKLLATGMLDAQPASSCSKPIATYLVGAAEPGVVEIGFECPDPTAVYELSLRLVQVGANGSVVAAGPTLIGAFTQSLEKQLDIQQTLADPGWPMFEAAEACLTTGGTRINGFIRIRRLHPKPPPTTPPPPPPCKDHSH